MFRQVLIIFILCGFFLTACGSGGDTTGAEAYPAPTSIPLASEAKLLPYPVDENNRPLIVNPAGSGPYPSPEGVEPYPAPGGEKSFAPAEGDEDKIRSDVFIDATNIKKATGDTNEYLIEITGSLRNPCYELRIVVLPPNEDSRIDVDVYAVISADSVCTQVLEPFDSSVSLGTYTGGDYSVWVNGEKIGDIQP
jgi:hypothetical protein